MSATSAPPTDVSARVHILPVAGGLAFAEARRLVTHPLVLLGAALCSAMIIVSLHWVPPSWRAD